MTCILACGCSGEKAAPAPSVDTSAVAEIHRTSFTQPLTAGEIQAFREVVAQLPGGRVPEFATASSLRVMTRNVSPARIVDEQRKRFRTTLDPFRQAQLWRIDPLVSEVLGKFGIEPEAFAMLTIRISAGWAGAAFVDEDGQTRCRSLKQTADRRIAELCGQIRRIDAVPNADSEQRRYLADALVETVALSEFLGLLSRVPPETIEVINEQRGLLEPLMPPAQTVAEFERHLESTAKVIPASYSAP